MVARVDRETFTHAWKSPEADPSDSDDVALALQTARALEAQGDLREAAKWLRRAVDAAEEDGNDERVLALARAAADLSTMIGSTPSPARAPSVAPTTAAGRGVIRAPAPKPASWSQPPALPTRRAVSNPPPLPVPPRETAPSTRTLPAARSTPIAAATSRTPPPSRASCAPVQPPRASSPAAAPRTSSPVTVRASSPPAPRAVVPPAHVAASASLRNSAPPAKPREPITPAPRGSIAPAPPARVATPRPSTSAGAASPAPSSPLPPAAGATPHADARTADQPAEQTIRVAIPPSVRSTSVFVVRRLEPGQSAPAGTMEAMLVVVVPS